MTKWIKHATALATTLTVASLTPAMAALHSDKEVGVVLLDDRPCTFFMLSGVTQADPLAGATHWFALPKSHPNYAELNAMLLTAKASKARVNVETNGATICGHAAVQGIQLP